VHATFASDVTRIRRESGAFVTQILRAKFAHDVRHVARVSCKCVRSAQQGMILSDPLYYCPLGEREAITGYCECTSVHTIPVHKNFHNACVYKNRFRLQKRSLFIGRRQLLIELIRHYSISESEIDFQCRYF
jgi:hypothetical protein